MIYTDDAYISGLLKKRKKDAHKGDFGKILIYAGSLGMAGAAILCGKAALRTGSGLVQFLLPQLPCEIYPILQTAVPEATCVAFSEDFDFNAYDAIACGCGIGQGPEAKKILNHILQHYGYHSSDNVHLSKNPDDASHKEIKAPIAEASKKVLLLDADALNLISKDPHLEEIVRTSPVSVIITPHVGEAKRLLNTCAGIKTVSVRSMGGTCASQCACDSLSDRKNAALDLAQKYHCIAVLKGAGTLVAAAGNFPIPLFENTTGNPGMATAGSGDTLAGIIVSLAGQSYAPLDAARAGVFLHGKAGDLAAEELGEMSVTAGDIGGHISAALKSSLS